MSKSETSVEAQLRAILENIPHMIFVKSAKDLRFVRFNRAGEELLGYDRNVLIGKSDYDFFPESEADFFTSKDRMVLSQDKVVDIPEEPIDTRRKGRRILHTKKIPLFDANGEPEFLLGISEDITDRKAAEEALRASEQRQRALISALPDVVLRVSIDGILLDYHAPEPTELAGMPHLFRGSPIQDALQPPLGQRFLEEITATGSTRRPRTMQYKTQTSEGHRILEARMVLSSDTEVVVIVRNITDSVEASELRRRFVERVMQAQEEERRRMARELHDETGQALAAMSVRLATLDTTDSLEEVRSQARLLRELVNQTMGEVSRLSRGLHPAILDDLGLDAAVTRLAHETKKQHGFNVDVEVLGQDVTQRNARLDTAAFRIVQEALTNVVKHAKATSVSIVIHHRADSVRIVIEDDGVGFDRERFRPGNGMGLHSMLERASAIGGAIDLDSAEGRGTIIVAHLPRTLT